MAMISKNPDQKTKIARVAAVSPYTDADKNCTVYTCMRLCVYCLQVHTFVREYFGDNDKSNCFAKEFIERRRSSEQKHVAKQANSVVSRGGGVGAQDEPESNVSKTATTTTTKKKKKQRMQKVDPSILGFSVNAAERVNMGEIQTVDES